MLRINIFLILVLTNYSCHGVDEKYFHKTKEGIEILEMEKLSRTDMKIISEEYLLLKTLLKKYGVNTLVQSVDFKIKEGASMERDELILSKGRNASIFINSALRRESLCVATGYKCSSRDHRKYKLNQLLDFISKGKTEIY